MCGLCGELRFDGAPVAAQRIESMLEPLARRGPNDSGTYADGPIGLGHRRLAIIDLSARGHQPMREVERDVALVFNGTIYNYPELRAELIARGHRFVSDGDTEVILRAWIEWDESCVDRLHGMFAFAIWDGQRRELFLARDRLGIKPLYFTRDGARLRFASNIQALLAGGGVARTLDPIALHHQFTLHGVVPAPRTVLAAVRKLEPGTSLSCTPDGRVTTRRYWSLRARRTHPGRGVIEWVDAIHDALKEAVRLRLAIADVPVGILLSGGLDSSLLVALAAEAGASDLRTFSIGFEDTPEESGSEFEFSDPVAERYATRHQRIRIPNSEVLERLPEAVAQMAEPMFGQDAVAFYLLAERVSREVRVVQSGQGADEVFGGYFWYPQMAQAERLSPLPRFAQHYFDRDHAELLELLAPGYAGPDYTGAAVAAGLDAVDADEFMDRVFAYDVTTLIVDDPVKRVDNMTMAWGLEARVPFLDHRLVELAAAMPPSMKLGIGKPVLKAIARGRLPDAVIDRPKGYFPVPALKFVRGPFLDFMRAVLDSDAARERGLYRRAYVDRMLAEPDRHLTRIRGSKLWQLAALELWLQRVVDPA